MRQELMTRRTSCTAAQSVRASGSAAASDYAATRGARQSRTISLDWDDEPGVDERVDLCGHLCRRCCRLQLPALPLPPPPERVASTVQWTAFRQSSQRSAGGSKAPVLPAARASPQLGSHGHGQQGRRRSQPGGWCQIDSKRQQESQESSKGAGFVGRRTS
eukprot:COSAG06_NODE_2113_length_7561_cov_2.657196_5_plen_161_part_00